MFINKLKHKENLKTKFPKDSIELFGNRRTSSALPVHLKKC